MADKSSLIEVPKPKEAKKRKQAPKPAADNPPRPKKAVKKAASPELVVLKTRVNENKPKDAIVTVCCPTPSEAVQTDSTLLWDASKHFKDKMIEAAKTEPVEQLVIKIYHSKAAFEVLTRWLRGGAIRQQDATLGLAEELHMLVDAHSLGDNLDTSAFQDAVMDAIIGFTIEHGKKFTISRLFPPKAKDFPSKTSPLRLLLADWIAYGEIDEQRSNVNQLPKESDFVRLLATTFVQRKIESKAKAPYVTNRCAYHYHRNVKPCPAKAPKGMKQESMD